MKPSIPDTGTVVSLEGGSAVVRMKHEGSCRSCGAAAMGLCKGGLMDVLTVRNALRARVGDAVKIGLGPRVQYRGLALAYVVPALAFIIGAAAGHFLGAYVGFPPLDILGGLTSLVAVSIISFRQLKRLDATHSIQIVQVLSGPWVPGASPSEEETFGNPCIDQAGPSPSR